MVVTVAVQPGDSIVPGQKLLTLEAMKMQSTITADAPGKVAAIHIAAGTQVEAGDLLITLE
jgi:pyruvate carboxylase